MKKNRPAVLFIAPTRIGDAVLSTSMLQEVMQRFPDACIDIVAGNLVAPLFERVPNVRHLHRIDKRKFSLHWLRIWRCCVTKRYACVIDMRGSGLAFTLRTQQRLIFRGSQKDISKHQQFSEFLGIDSAPMPTLWTHSSDENFAHRFCNNALIFAFAPIANWPPKEWPLDSFIALASALLTKHPNHRPMLICAAHERERMQPMIDALAAHQPLLLCDGSASLRQVYACLKRAKLFIGNDSGLMHMAAAASIPTLGLFGPTPIKTYRPAGIHAHAMNAETNKLEDLPVETVLARAEALLL